VYLSAFKLFARFILRERCHNSVSSRFIGMNNSFRDIHLTYAVNYRAAYLLPFYRTIYTVYIQCIKSRIDQLYKVYIYYTFDVVLLQDNYQQQSQNRQRFQEFVVQHQCPATHLCQAVDIHNTDTCNVTSHRNTLNCSL
jgi:hypothetical protein